VIESISQDDAKDLRTKFLKVFWRSHAIASLLGYPERRIGWSSASGGETRAAFLFWNAVTDVPLSTECSHLLGDPLRLCGLWVNRPLRTNKSHAKRQDAKNRKVGYHPNRHPN
jgi:hypothetical protein